MITSMGLQAQGMHPNNSSFQISYAGILHLRQTPLSTGFHISDQWIDGIELDRPPFLNSIKLSYNKDLNQRWNYGPGLTYSWISVNVGGGRAFFRDSLGDPILLDSEQTFRTRNTEAQFRLALDLLSANRDEGFFIYAQLGIAYWNRQDNYIERLEDSPNSVYNSVIKTRHGLVPIIGLGLKWEEYVSEDWGYFIDLLFIPNINFSPTSVTLRNVVTDGTEYADEQFNRGVLIDELEENLRYSQFRAGVGISYRF